MSYLTTNTLLYIGLFYLVPLILGIYSQYKVTHTFNKYSKVSSSSNISASEFAKKLLQTANINDINITKCSGSLTDHYNPKKQYIALSETVYNSTSVASLGVVAHEIGHVLQYKNNYKPIKFRQFLYPILNFSNKFMWLILLGGLIISIFVPTILNVGEIMLLIFIAIYGLSALFSLVTLPIEKNASKRALSILESTNTLNDYELEQAKSVLDAAALTYVASIVSSLLVLLRLILVFKSNRD